MPRLPRSFYTRPAQTVARDLLGCTLVRILPDGTRLAGIIVETEAYVGVKDSGCHSHQGRRTPKNEAMYMQGGTFYVYFTYGMHFCCNVVCGKPDEPIAVLIRALEPVEGTETMLSHRRIPAPKTPGRNICDGPGKLCQALAISKPENGVDLVTSDYLWIEPRPTIGKLKVTTGPRIGLSTETVWKDKLLRFGLANHSCLSKPFPSKLPKSAKPRGSKSKPSKH
ncbi:MAG: DNA-3-methyladenine glycosylase [Phycisphaerales bacterium]